MPTIIPADRSQLTFMTCLDDMVAPDHPVRLIDTLIDKIIELETEFFDHLAPQSSVGRRGYSEAALIKLFMYGYIHGISSSRKLEAKAACGRFKPKSTCTAGHITSNDGLGWMIP